jgi:hypothetical protein
MESWRQVWVEGFQVQFANTGLIGLHSALVADDEKLLQGKTTNPPPLQSVNDWPTEGCCPVSWASSGDPIAMPIGFVVDSFAKSCYEADRRLGEPAACRWFLNWWDDAPRQEAVSELLSEVRKELIQRGLYERIQVQDTLTTPDKPAVRRDDCPF